MVSYHLNLPKNKIAKQKKIAMERQQTNVPSKLTTENRRFVYKMHKYSGVLTQNL